MSPLTIKDPKNNEIQGVKRGQKVWPLTPTKGKENKGSSTHGPGKVSHNPTHERLTVNRRSGRGWEHTKGIGSRTAGSGRKKASIAKCAPIGSIAGGILTRYPSSPLRIIL